MRVAAPGILAVALVVRIIGRKANMLSGVGKPPIGTGLIVLTTGLAVTTGLMLITTGLMPITTGLMPITTGSMLTTAGPAQTATGPAVTATGRVLRTTGLGLPGPTPTATAAQNAEVEISGEKACETTRGRRGPTVSLHQAGTMIMRGMEAEGRATSALINFQIG
jgi:hypothetical protein